MTSPVCAYCGDAATEWGHFRPLVIAQQPTGYISEIHNLVPACGKCNQSKGNKNWRELMLGSARLSPRTRGVADLADRVARLEAFEGWGTPTRVDLEALAGAALWAEHWRNHRDVLALLRKAEETASRIRDRIAVGNTALAIIQPVAGAGVEL